MRDLIIPDLIRIYDPRTASSRVTYDIPSEGPKKPEIRIYGLSDPVYVDYTFNKAPLVFTNSKNIALNYREIGPPKLDGRPNIRGVRDFGFCQGERGLVDMTQHLQDFGNTIASYGSDNGYRPVIPVGHRIQLTSIGTGLTEISVDIENLPEVRGVVVMPYDEFMDRSVEIRMALDEFLRR